MSKVAYISSLLAVSIAELISFIEVSLSNPELNSLSSMLIAILLFFLASGPEPIPSLIAKRYFPSPSLTCDVMSPETIAPSFLALAIPV